MKKPNIHFDPNRYRESNVLNFDDIVGDSEDDNEIFPDTDEE